MTSIGLGDASSWMQAAGETIKRELEDGLTAPPGPPHMIFHFAKGPAQVMQPPPPHPITRIPMTLVMLSSLETSEHAGTRPVMVSRRAAGFMRLWQSMDVRPIIPQLKKLYYERADYSVVVKKQGTSSEGMEVGDLPCRKCQPDQAVTGLFRDYDSGQAGGERCP